MIRLAGWLIVFYGTAHTLGALTVEGAWRHAGVWFSGGLWDGAFSNMSPAMSAYWFSLDSFGIPLILLGLTIVWMNRRKIVPPAFVAWVLTAWTAVDAMILLLTPWPILMLANVLLLLGIRKASVSASS